MALSTAPFFSFSAFFDSEFERVIVSWAVIETLDVVKVHVEVNRGAGFIELDVIDEPDNRIVDNDGAVDHAYRLIGEAADGELWIPTESFQPQTSFEPLSEITGTIEDAQGNPVFNAVVKAFLLPVEGLSATSRAITSTIIETKTNALGEFKMTLVQGAPVRFEIPKAQISFPTLIPEKGQVKFGDLEALEGDLIR